MALKGTLDHPKLIALADALDIDPCYALGVVEALWHFTDKYATEGDIGKFSNRVITNGLRSMVNPDDLIRALVDTGWVDEDAEHRLVVHDWHEHSSKSTKAKVQKRGKPFVTGQDARRNTNGRPPQTANTANETANEESDTAKPESVSANGTAKITANENSVTAKKLPRARSGNQEPVSRNQGSYNPPSPPSENQSLPCGANRLPEGVERFSLSRVREDQGEFDIECLDTGKCWMWIGDEYVPIAKRVGANAGA